MKSFSSWSVCILLLLNFFEYNLMFSLVSEFKIGLHKLSLDQSVYYSSTHRNNETECVFVRLMFGCIGCYTNLTKDSTQKSESWQVTVHRYNDHRRTFISFPLSPI